VSMKQFDIIVIGGGPAGSTFAVSAIRLGHNVLILDKAKFPRNKLCAGWLNPAAFKILGIKKEDYPYKIDSWNKLLVWSRKKDKPRKFKLGLGHSIFRKEFDYFLLQRAIKAGAVLKQALVSDVEFKDDCVIVKTSKENFKSKVVVGAGGTFCPLYNKFNKGLKEKIVVCLEFQGKIKGTRNIGVNILPEKDLRGYSWCSSKADQINIGIGRTNEPDIVKYKDALIKRLERIGLIPKDLNLKFEGYVYRLNDNPKRKVAGNRFILLGDSAGLSDNFSGEGISQAIVSGKVGANYVARCLRAGKSDLSGFGRNKMFRIQKTSQFVRKVLKLLIKNFFG